MQWVNGNLKTAHLPAGECHIWLVQIAADVSSDLLQHLPRTEQERATRFRHTRDAAAFVTARSALRQLLARYLNTSATESSFAIHYSETGRPFIANDSNLDFNISHSGSYALLGFIRNARIGVDIEQMRPDMDWTSVREMLPNEVGQQVRGGSEHLESSYIAWTRYEALAKGVGGGIATQASFVHAGESPWQYMGLPPVPGYAIAAVVNAATEAVRPFRWPD